jgi:hypothetical protein
VRTVPAHAGFLVALLPPFFVITVPYVGLRALLRGRTRPFVDRGPAHFAGVLLVTLGVVIAVVVAAIAAVEIV